MTEADVKVVVIVGRGRSGSTILDNLLGELDGFVSVGELHNLFKRGLVLNEICGCGRQVGECELWTKVLGRALNGIEPVEVVAWQRRVVGKARDARRLLRHNRGERLPQELDSYVALLGRVYRAVADLAEARVVVDSSKRPPHAALMHLVEGVTPYFVQLVRDPRAVAYSRRREKGALRTQGPLSNGIGWMHRNFNSEAVRRRHPSSRSLLVRYEDFVVRPRETVEAIVSLVEENALRLPFVDDRTATLGPNHNVAGNPSRFKTGTVTLRMDDEWLLRQSVSDRLVTTAVTLPLLRRYRYPVWPSAPRQRVEVG